MAVEKDIISVEEIVSSDVNLVLEVVDQFEKDLLQQKGFADLWDWLDTQSVSEQE